MNERAIAMWIRLCGALTLVLLLLSCAVVTAADVVSAESPGGAVFAYGYDGERTTAASVDGTSDCSDELDDQLERAARTQVRGAWCDSCRLLRASTAGLEALEQRWRAFVDRVSAEYQQRDLTRNE